MSTETNKLTVSIASSVDHNDGVQEALALLLHFHHQQFEAVFTEGQ